MASFGTLVIDGWAGRREHRVEIIRATKTRYVVRLLSLVILPRHRQYEAGDVVWVPKTAVKTDPNDPEKCQSGHESKPMECCVTGIG